jgi:hypothetical protein
MIYREMVKPNRVSCVCISNGCDDPPEPVRNRLKRPPTRLPQRVRGRPSHLPSLTECEHVCYIGGVIGASRSSTPHRNGHLPGNRHPPLPLPPEPPVPKPAALLFSGIFTNARVTPANTTSSSRAPFPSSRAKSRDLGDDCSAGILRQVQDDVAGARSSLRDGPLMWPPSVRPASSTWRRSLRPNRDGARSLRQR